MYTFLSFSFCNFPRRKTRRYSLNNKPTQMTAQLLLDPRRFDLSFFFLKHSAAGFYSTQFWNVVFIFFFFFSIQNAVRIYYGLRTAHFSLYVIHLRLCFLPKMFWKVLLHVSDLFLSLSGLPEKGIIIRVGIQQFLRVLGWPPCRLPTRRGDTRSHLQCWWWKK